MIIVFFARMLSCLKMDEAGVTHGQSKFHRLATICGDPAEAPFCPAIGNCKLSIGNLVAAERNEAALWTPWFVKKAG